MAWKPNYVTDPELRDYATRSTETVDDAYVALAATSASRAVDNHTFRQFGKVDASEARRYTARWDRRRSRFMVEIDDLYDATGLVVTVAAGTVDVLELEPVNALKVGKVYERIVIEPESANRPTGREANEVTVTTAKWGWPAFPAPVKQAALLQGNRFIWRRDAPAGVAGSPDSGSEVRLLARLDADVAVALTDYVRWWGAG
ncbi:MAG TPA: hypothetical protein VFC00_32575 [Micromonosporaceae bacterium]|nr:hypothetical protein [Micromonosporaceae bacterium]